jgi:hypothetical protein
MFQPEIRFLFFVTVWMKQKGLTVAERGLPLTRSLMAPRYLEAGFISGGM